VNVQEFEDVYGEDKRGTLHADWDDIQVLDPAAISQRTGVLDAPAAIDIQPGYLLEIKKRKVVGRSVSAVTAEVENPSEGDTSLTVDTTTRFEPGDFCVLTDGSGSYGFRLKAVDEENSSLSMHEPLPRAFTSATVAAKEFWLVTGIKSRDAHSEYQSLRVRQTTLRAAT
jgi:hypothetical protein